MIANTIEKKLFTGGLNGDDSLARIAADEIINGFNLRALTSERGEVEGLQPIAGTTLLFNTLPAGTNIGLGGCWDEGKDRLLYLNWNSNGSHAIYCYSFPDATGYKVLLNAAVTGGLNFNKLSCIHSCWVVGDLLYWVEGTNNQPRKINIEAGIKMNHPSFSTEVIAYPSPLDFREITLIKPPPPLSPNIVKNADATFVNNFIANESFMFAFQYVYYDNETSVVGTYSPASKLNTTKNTDDGLNRIVVTMDTREQVPQTVRQVNLFCRVGNACYNVKTWDKANADDAEAIAFQNAGSFFLTFNFYNTVKGAFLAPADILKPFDSVPVNSGAGGFADGRNFLGDNTVGYDAPLVTSLSTELVTINPSSPSFSKNLIAIACGSSFSFPIAPDKWYYRAWYVYLTEIVPKGYYALIATEKYTANFSEANVPFPPPTTVALSGLSFKGLTIVDVEVSVKPSGMSPSVGHNVQNTTNNCVITGTIINTYPVFKSRSAYLAGNVFYDFAMRKCGVVTNEALKISIPARSFAYTSGISNISWSLDNTNALTEIPVWAYYYTPALTKNLTTRFFIESFDDGSKYVTKDADGNYVYTNDVYIATAVAIGINTDALVRAGLGYVFSEGDVCVITASDNKTYVLPVIGQDGKYVLVKAPAGGIGDFSAITIIYEIYTPYQTSEQEPYYEMGKMYKVANPGTADRQYEITSGFFNADTFAFTRNYNSVTYFAEAMSPNDLFYQRWDTDAGKVNIVTKLGQQREQYIAFSNTFIPGTAVNGLSTFEALNKTAVPLENGVIRKLILTSKVQEQGTVMLAICTKETSSIYLGETRVTDATGQTKFFVSSEGVIGTINPLKGSFGTSDPESVQEFRGNVFWYDVNNGGWVQYSSNGLEFISKYKTKAFGHKWSQKYTSLSKSAIEALGSRPFVFGGIDPFNEEYFCCIPKLEATNPNGTLPGFTQPPYTPPTNLFPIYDGDAKAVVYKINENKWQIPQTFSVDYMIYANNQLFSIKNGALWKHGDTAAVYNKFHGVQYDSKVMVVANNTPGAVKLVNAVSVQGTQVPSRVLVYTKYPNEQCTNLDNTNFKNLEGVFYSEVRRDRNSPGNPSQNVNVANGNRMRSEAMQLEFDFAGGAWFQLRAINIITQISVGHKTLTLNT